MSTELESVTDASFDTDVLQANVPVLVDYWAAWCAPCRALAPTLEAIAKDYQGKIKVLKLDVSNNQEMPAKYNVRGIPTLILYKQGTVVATHVGGDIAKSQLAALIDSHL